MVDDDDKPFPCSSPGCSMSFTNEDHLSIHKKRHVMALAIDANGAKTPTFIADETPTPTRFIRNCEEVGLFQDLQNVNPFDEQFRRAAEAVITSPSSATQRYSDDALHTPHVFPLTAEAELTPLYPPKSASLKRPSLIPALSTSDLLPISPLPAPSIIITPPSDPVVSKEVARSEKEIPPQQQSPATDGETPKKKGRKSVMKSTKNSTISSVNIMPKPPTDSPVSNPLHLLLRLPDGRLVQIPAIPVANNEPVLQPAVTNTSNSNSEQSKTALSEAKMKLKQVLTKAKPGNSIKSPRPSSVMTTSDNSGNETDHGALSKAVESICSSRRRSCQSASDPDGDEDENEKRKKFLERNRAAAFRSRQKRKRWVSNLEAKTAALNNANRLLQNEVCSLKAEVAQLKLQLLAHRDCPVTLAMCSPDMTNQNKDGVIISTNVSKSLLAVASPPPPSRQIIILNAGNQLVNKPISPSIMINQPPLVVLPGVHREEASISVNASPRQEPSVIISLRPDEK